MYVEQLGLAAGEAPIIDVRGKQVLIVKVTGSGDYSVEPRLYYASAYYVTAPQIIALVDSTAFVAPRAVNAITGPYTYAIPTLGANEIRFNVTGTGTVSLRATGTETNALTDLLAVPYSPQNVTYHASQLTPGNSSADFDIRDTSDHDIIIPHGSARVFDQVLTLRSTLDAELSYSLAVRTLHTPPSGVTAGPVLYDSATTGGNLESGGVQPRHVIFSPVVSPGYVKGAAHQIVEIPELERPYREFRLQVKALETPTAGTLRLISERRF